jgi:Arc/MetJ-type ribon-helix-helix transcriptional regulator
MLTAMPQIVTRLDERLVAAVDQLVAEGVVSSRSEAVRLGLEVLIDTHRRGTVAAAIVEGYRRRPQSAGELGWADDATVRMIAEEPW